MTDSGRAFRHPNDRTTAAQGCPDADTLRAAAALEAPAGGRRKVLDHVALCPACTVAWCTVRELLETQPAQAPARSWRSPVALAAVAAAAALAVALFLLPTPQRDAPVQWRVSGASIDWGEVADQVALDPAAPRLVWPAGPDGTLYEVRLLTVDLDRIARATRLSRPEWDIDPAALATLPAGSIVLWQVVATLPDGHNVESPTFRALVSGPAP